MATAVGVLIVEDDILTRNALISIMARRFPDLTVYVAEDGTGGLDLFKEHTPDIVITDVNMPRMGGKRMVEEIRSLNGDTKVIIITGCSDKNHREQFTHLGISEYLGKPLEIKRLFEASARCVEEVRLARSK